MFTPTKEIVEFIASYMNESHQEALIEIARAAGFEITEAAIVDLTAEALILEGFSGSEKIQASIAWPSPLQQREDVRRYLQQMQEDARFA